MSAVSSLDVLLKDLRSESFRNKGAYNKVCEEFAKQVNAEACSIFILNSETNRLVMRGDCGHDKSYVDDESDDYTYATDEGVTGDVFTTGEPSRKSNVSQVETAQGHKSKLFKQQWYDDHICYSWYQFPIKNLNDRSIGIMKIENKRDENNEYVIDGGFSDEEVELLDLVANLIVPFILMNQTRDSAGWTSDIYGIFTKDIIGHLKDASQKPDLITACISRFCQDVESRENCNCDYVSLATDYIIEISKIFEIDEKTMKYCELLNEYETVLYQIPSYRGHYVHQFNVFLNGYVILKNLSQRNVAWFYKSFNGINDFFTGCPDDRKFSMLLKAWFVIALFHDTGYPISKIEKWTESFLARFLYGGSTIRQDNTASRGLNEKLAANLRPQVLRDLIDMSRESSLWLGLDEADTLSRIHELFFEKLSDSVVPGIILKRAFENDASNQWLIGAAISAILLDDEDTQMFIKEKTNEPRFFWRKHPLAFLLAMCDAAQEIGRAKGDAVRIRKDSVINQALIVKKKDKKISWKLEYSVTPEGWDENIKPKIEHIEHFWQTHQDIQVSIDYMAGGHSFQRLHIGTEP